MNDIEAVGARISRRAYQNTGLTEKQRSQLDQAVKRCNETSGLTISLWFDRPELFGGFLKSYGLLAGVRNLFVMAGPKNDPHLAEKIGYYGERLVLEATKLDLDTCWVGGSYDRKAVRSIIADADTALAVIAFGNAGKEYSPRERFIRLLAHRRKTNRDQFFLSDGTEPAWFQAAIDLVVKAPSAVNQQPVVFTVENGVIQSGLRIHNAAAMVDLGIAKLHFGLACPTGFWAWGENGIFTYR